VSRILLNLNFRNQFQTSYDHKKTDTATTLRTEDNKRHRHLVFGLEPKNLKNRICCLSRYSTKVCRARLLKRSNDSLQNNLIQRVHLKPLQKKQN
jgi:hypothetical protein